MGWFHDLRIRTKIITSFSVITILTAIAGYQGIRETTRFRHLAEKLSHEELADYSLIKEASTDLMRMENSEKNLLLSRDGEERRRYRGEIDKDKSAFLSVLAKARNLASSEREKEVNNLMDQMNLITQQIASNAGESAGGADELSEQADELKNMVLAFRFSGKSESAMPSEMPVNSTQMPRHARLKDSENDAGDLVFTRSIPSNPIVAHAAEMIPFGETDSMDPDRF